MVGLAPVGGPPISVAARSHAVNASIKINGVELPSDRATRVKSVSVTSVLQGPSSAEIIVHDPKLEIPVGWKVGAPMTVEVKDSPLPGLGSLTGGSPAPPLFDGEIVAVEAVRDESQSMIRLRAHDKLHRLFHGRKTTGHQNMTYSDIARKIASSNGIPALQVGNTAVVHEFVPQVQESDGEFLTRLALEVGFVLRMTGGKLIFDAPPEVSSAPAPGSPGNSTPRQLVLGDDVRRFEVSCSAEQVNQTFKAFGWDPKAKKEVVGQSTADAAKQTGTIDEIDSASLGSALNRSSWEFTTSALPARSPKHAEQLAKGLAVRSSSTIVQARVESLGNPSLVAGETISIAGAGTLTGSYVVTTAEHEFGPGGYMTNVICGGLLDGPEGTAGASPARAPLMASTMIGIVSNNRDPENLGRVKVKFPQLDAMFESDWLRIVSPGAGPERGWHVVPEVGDEVLVTFEHGDYRHGYVLGGLWNGKDKPKLKTDEAVVDGKVEKRSFRTRAGHQILFNDTKDAESIEVSTANQKLVIKMEQKTKAITIEMGDTNKTTMLLDDKGLSITTAKEVKVEATENILLESKKDVTIKGMNVKVDAQTNFEAKAASKASVEGTGSVEVKSSGTAKLDGAQTTVSGQAMTEVKGGLVKIN